MSEVNTMSESGRSAETGHVSHGSGIPAHGMPSLWFSCCEANVPVSFLKDSPVLMVAAVEDLCWQLALSEWAEREPPRYERARHRTWKGEARHHADKRARVRAMVDEALMAS